VYVLEIGISPGRGIFVNVILEKIMKWEEKRGEMKKEERRKIKERFTLKV
jgi:hypothetical protein